MSIKKELSLRLINNTDRNIETGVLGGDVSDWFVADNTVIVDWDILTITPAGSSVTLGTTIPKTAPLLSNTIEAVVQVLNGFRVANFQFTGTIIYAHTLLDESVKTADLTIE